MGHGSDQQQQSQWRIEEPKAFHCGLRKDSRITVCFNRPTGVVHPLEDLKRGISRGCAQVGVIPSKHEQHNERDMPKE
ncbi:MAG: hypothetical protein IPL86_04380 [Flavobacteriales bacterium]|nr:hypothetical protein [Flavobacteriales bacterium]